MARSSRPGPKVGSLEWRRRVSEGTRRGQARVREFKRVKPRDLDRLRTEGEVSAPLRPLLAIAEDEARELFNQLGGPDNVSPAKRMLIEDTVAVGVALRGQVAIYLRTGDAEAASRVGTLASTRRSSLAAIGLEHAKQEIDLGTYLAQRETPQDRPQRANGSGPAQPPEADDVVPAEHDTSVTPTEETTP